jgi:K+-transporting ATPase KdpF subunit
MVINNPAGLSTSPGYLLGGIIALFLLGYLLYTLFAPEKF